MITITAITIMFYKLRITIMTQTLTFSVGLKNPHYPFYFVISQRFIKK
jgi:hypothetical protein